MLLKIDQNYFENSEIWSWRRMEKVSWTDRMRNEEVLQTIKEERIILPTVQGRLTGLGTYCAGTCFFKHVTEGKIEGTERRRRRCMHLSDDTLWRTRFGRGYEHDAC
jgi:hypothetical protein